MRVRVPPGSLARLLEFHRPQVANGCIEIQSYLTYCEIWGCSSMLARAPGLQPGGCGIVPHQLHLYKGPHVPRLGDRHLQCPCGGFNSHRLHYSSMKKLAIFTDKVYQRNHKSSLLVRFQPTVRCRVLRFYISLKLLQLRKKNRILQLQFSWQNASLVRKRS